MLLSNASSFRRENSKRVGKGFPSQMTWNFHRCAVWVCLAGFISLNVMPTDASSVSSGRPDRTLFTFFLSIDTTTRASKSMSSERRGLLWKDVDLPRLSNKSCRNYIYSCEMPEEHEVETFDCLSLIHS